MGTTPEPTITGINLITIDTKKQMVVDAGSRKIRLIAYVIGSVTLVLAAILAIGLFIVTTRLTQAKAAQSQAIQAEASYATQAALLSFIKQRVKAIADVQSRANTWEPLFPIAAAIPENNLSSVSVTEKRDVVFQGKSDTMDEVFPVFAGFIPVLQDKGAKNVILESFRIMEDGSVRFSVTFRI